MRGRSKRCGRLPALIGVALSLVLIGAPSASADTTDNAQTTYVVANGGAEAGDDVTIAESSSALDDEMPAPLSLLLLVILGLPVFILGRRRIRVAVVAMLAVTALIALQSCDDRAADEPPASEAKPLHPT